MATFALIGGAMVNLDNVCYFENSKTEALKVNVFFADGMASAFDDTVENVLKSLSGKPLEGA